MRIVNGRIEGKIYDVYYSTGGGSLVGGGSDVWVNHWIKEVSPHLEVQPVLLIHRVRPTDTTIEEQDKIFKELNPNLKVYTSYGYKDDIFILAGQSNVSFWGVDDNNIGHTLRSVFIDPERRLMKTFDGTDWRTEIVERNIRNIMKVYY